jgi:hypothetical protein
MKRELGPRWTAKEERAGKRSGAAWEAFFAEGENASRKAGAPAGKRPAALAGDAAAAEAQARHEAELLRYPNVVGVATGIRTRRGKPTGEACVVVYVARKLPRARLAAKDLLPSEIDGVPVDVVEAGRIEPLPA